MPWSRRFLSFSARQQQRGNAAPYVDGCRQTGSSCPSEFDIQFRCWKQGGIRRFAPLGGFGAFIYRAALAGLCRRDATLAAPERRGRRTSECCSFFSWSSAARSTSRVHSTTRKM